MNTDTDKISQNFRAKLYKEAREHLFYSKFHRALALVTLLLGFVISGIIYDIISDGSFMIIFKKPITILYLFVPIIPSSIFAFVAHRRIKKFYKVLEKGQIDENDLRKRTELYSNETLKSG